MTQKQLPCRFCGTPVTIPAKYARSKGAVAAADDALARRQDSLRACRQALRIGLRSMLRSN